MDTHMDTTAAQESETPTGTDSPDIDALLNRHFAGKVRADAGEEGY